MQRLEKYDLTNNNLCVRKLEHYFILEKLKEFKNLFNDFYLTLKETK